MYIQIGGTSYSNLRNVQFSPEINVAGTALPVPEFSADIVTDDTINVGDFATMVGADNLHFAKYWILFSERVQPGVVRIRAQSRLTMLDRKILPAKMYESGSAYVYSVLQDIFRDMNISEYYIPPGYSLTPFSGFFPEQTARERLLWLCLAVGTFVKTFGDTDTSAEVRDKIEFLPILETAQLVPLEKTFLRPAVTYSDYVTAVTATSYSFTEREPQSGEASVTDGTKTWVVTKQDVTLSNPDAPSAVPENVIKVPDVMVINSSNVDDILSRMAKYYFPRMSIELDAVNNGEWFPGSKLQVYTGLHSIASGYAERMDFRFGIQSRAKIHLKACAEVESASLVVRYLYQNAELARQQYYFPVGYSYSIKNRYPDVTAGKLRTIFYTENEYATGTVAQGGSTNNQPCQQALVLNNQTKILKILSVDAVSVAEKTVDGETVLVGVIT